MNNEPIIQYPFFKPFILTKNANKVATEAAICYEKIGFASRTLNTFE